jgi:16S rRNA (adenine1518-N6/adenine1519-N6)-dimethyltransferase
MPTRLPDTKERIREALERHGLRPHKRFGQNFLGDPAVLDRIVAASGVGAGSVALEVGPGLGGLTERLLGAGALVVAVEIDHGLARALRAELASEALVLVEGDVLGARGRIAEDVSAALAAAIEKRGAAGFDVVSNLPYGISSPFLASLLVPPGPPLSATLTLQSEFADVLLGRPGTDAYSALSVAAQTFFDVTRAFGVARGAFHPAPDVDSAVVRLAPRMRAGPDPESFGRFVQKLFQGRRKALSTTVGPLLGKPSAAAREWLQANGFDPLARVDALPPERLAALFGAVVSSRS